MPPPSSFVDITTIPFSRVITQAEFNVANEFWFRFITATGKGFSSTSTKPAGASVFANFYHADGTTLISRLRVTDSWVWLSVSAGTFYIKLDIFPVGPISADFTYQADTKTLDEVTFDASSVLIPDDSGEQIPALVLEPDGNIPVAVSSIPTGEIADSLPNGYILAHDRYGKYAVGALVLINPDLTLNQTITSLPFTGSLWPRITHSSTDFYVLLETDGRLWKVTTAGVITLVATIASIATAGQVTPFGINSDASIAYFAINNNSGNILKCVIATDTTTTHHTIAGFSSEDRIAKTYNFNPGDLIVLPDGSLVTWWDDEPLRNSKVIHVSSGGILLNSITFADPIRVNHLSYASATASTHVKAWVFLTGDSGVSKIGDLNLSTGIFDTSFTIDTFFTGSNAGTDTNHFGPSSSCPFITLLPPQPPGSGEPGPGPEGTPGLFKIVPNKRTDHNGTTHGKLPNPTFRTGLIP